jgi:hypothetical protein
VCLVNVFGEGIVKFKPRNFQTLYAVPTKHKHFGIKIYKHSDMTGYTCSTKVYLGKVQHTVTDELMMHAINCSNRI